MHTLPGESWHPFEVIDLDPGQHLPRWRGSPEEAGEAALDRAGAVRTARRRLDLSQRDLARVLRVSRSVIERAEDPSAEPSFELVARILALAGLRVVVVSTTGEVVEPEPVDVARDNADRRYPAHLDVYPAVRRDRPIERRDRPPVRATYQHRWARDRRRARQGVVYLRHPTTAEVTWAHAPQQARCRYRPFEPVRHRPWPWPDDAAAMPIYGYHPDTGLAPQWPQAPASHRCASRSPQPDATISPSPLAPVSPTPKSPESAAAGTIGGEAVERPLPGES